MDLGKPRAHERYVLIANGDSRAGRTDENGVLREPISSDARIGRLLIGNHGEEIALNFGCVDPITEISGVKTRLQNLGFYFGEINDQQDPDFLAAIAEFQRSQQLPGEGELTAETREALVKIHGS